METLVALDGTKIAANASLARNRDATWIRRVVAKLMAVTGEDEQSTAAGSDPLPGVEPVAAISSPAGRLATLRAALAVIETEDAAEDAAQAAAIKRDTEAAAAEAEHGRKLRGRKPIKDPAAALARAEADLKAAQQRADTRAAERAAKVKAAAAEGRPMTGPTPGPDQRLEQARAHLERARAAANDAQPKATPRQVNLTDPDSRIMTTKDGWVQGYNAQAIVNPQQIVLACDVSQNAGDVQLYEPMNDRLTQTLTAGGITAEIELELADAGYCSEANLTCPGPDRLIATQKDHKQRRAARELSHTTGPPPDGTPIEEMEHLLRTPQGAAAYKQRSSLIEPVFGDRKHNREIRRFRRRGINAARSEWAFIHLAGNIRKLYQHHTAQLA